MPSTLIQIFNNFIDMGSKPNARYWENVIVRKINMITLIGTFNVFISFILFPLIGIYDFQVALLTCIIAGPLVIFLNIKKGYLWGSYSFFLVGVYIMLFMSIKLGMESYFMLFYFPITLAVVQLLGRRETFKHLIIILSLFFVSIAFVSYAYTFNLYKIVLDVDDLSTLRIFNILLSAFTGMAFISQITIENIKQEEVIKSVLKEKELLLAEVFHRVKNNMNIVTSLLNLKKGVSVSKEAIDALEDCRNRVFSMALVHQKIFNRKDLSGINFKEYIKDLVDEIQNAFSLEHEVRVNIKANEIEIPLNKAIPMGLILNELITNSFKHAVEPGKLLIVDIVLEKSDNSISFIYQDNGPGITTNKPIKAESLGLELIHSLTDQLNGKPFFNNINGFEFKLSFNC